MLLMSQDTCCCQLHYFLNHTCCCVPTVLAVLFVLYSYCSFCCGW
jgi:hypothetical protein